MLSYRHAFHAGNHADVLKHAVYSLVLNYFNQKDKPYWVVDTHAGAGIYALHDEFAQKNAEFEQGIARLMQAKNLPDVLNPFVECVRSFNTKQDLDLYPGSPKIAEYFLRDSDKLRLFELHPSDCKLLIQHFMGQGKQTKIEMLNGFEGIKACLPPPTKRGMVLIDPPYELKQDYDDVVQCIQESLKRFATGTYLIWYPLLQRAEPKQMVANLSHTITQDYLNVTLSVECPNPSGFGMFGSGMFVINPPWQLPKLLEDIMPFLVEQLGLDDQAQFTLDARIR